MKTTHHRAMCACGECADKRRQSALAAAKEEAEARRSAASCSPSSLERLANSLEMPVDHVREAAEAISQERNDKLVASLMSKVALIRERNTAIMPTGEIVARGTPGAMNYESPENA